MIFNYVVCILVVIGILGLFYGWKLIQHFNYELNYKESFLFSISILILISLCLFDFSFIQIHVDLKFSIIIVIYFLSLLILYYITRSIKLKKYIPLKSIIYYILISFINLTVLFIIITKFTSNIDGSDALGLFAIYILLNAAYFIILIHINILIWIIKTLRKDEINYKNTSYKISKFCFINFIAIVLIIELVFSIDYFNAYNHKKMNYKQKNIAERYLKDKYSKYKFEIINSYEEKVDCWMFGCNTTVLKVDFKNIDFDKNFSIMVNKDLSIYDDGFKKIYKEEQKNNITKYLKDNYNVLLNYKIKDEKLENVEFIIGKNYQKDEIDLFIQDMKSVFNYIDNNFYDIDYVILNFKNGNPFYEGKNEYSKTRGSINENSMTDELWIMVNDEYIFVKK